jgi:Holliday junction resolvase
MKNETTAVKNPIKKMLKARGIEHITITTGGFGSSGWPDICFLYRGIFVGIECKFGKNKPSALQEKRLDYIKAQGGIAMLANEENVGDVEFILKQIDVFWLDTFAMDRIKDACFKGNVKLWRDK